MRIVVNGEPTDVENGLTIERLLQQLQLEPRYVAVERNLQLIPRGDHAESLLQEDDQLEIVTLVGGG